MTTKIYNPFEREPLTLDEFVGWFSAHQESSSPVRETGDCLFLKCYCVEFFGEFSFRAILRLEARFAIETNMTHKDDDLPLRTMARHFRKAIAEEQAAIRRLRGLVDNIAKTLTATSPEDATEFIKKAARQLVFFGRHRNGVQPY